MNDRRPMGSLESEVLAALWAIGEPAGAAQVREQVGDDLAYTTVNTILMRLHAKGVLRRKTSGRAFLYEPEVTEAELTAQRMLDQLEQTSDRNAALSQFVGTLSKKDERILRKLLESGGI